MALGFVKQYDTSLYDLEQFLEIWPEIAEIGTEICEYIEQKMDASIVIAPGSKNDVLSYIKGCLFMIGFSEVDKGMDAELYDAHTTSAVLKCRAVMSSMGIENEQVDSINLKFVQDIKRLFEILDQDEISKLWKVLKDNKVNFKFPKEETKQVPTTAPPTTPASGVPPATPDPNASASIIGKTASSIAASQIKPGINYPKDTKTAKNSIVYSVAKDGHKMLSKNFKVSDFKCKDESDVVLINPKLIDLLEKIQAHFGKKININSGYRTPSYNSNVEGAAKNSQHQYGNAADISIKGVTPSEIHAWLNDWHAGGLGLYKTFVHVDVRDDVGWKKFARWGLKNKLLTNLA